MMKIYNVLLKQAARTILLTACAVTIAVTFMVVQTRPARADKVTPPPPVPANIQVPAGNKLFLVGHAVGTQNYICLPSGAGFAFKLFTPQATLFDDLNEQTITHYFSPNPSEGGTVRPTWQHSQDTSKVWAKGVPGAASTDPDYVAPGAIPWLLLQVVNHQDGPTGGDKLSAATYIQRLNTTGGAIPSTGCAVLTDLGNTAFVPYTADYYFYK